MGTLVGILVALPFMAAFFIVAMLVDGWAAMMLWNWFMPTIGIKAITVWQALGLGLLTRMVSHQYVPKSGGEGELQSLLQHIFLRPLIVVACGWAVKAWSGI